MATALLTTTLKFVGCYAIWGIITVCDPVLVSEEAAQKSKVLETAKDITDLMVVGCKLAFTAPIIAVTETLKKIGS